MTNKCYLLITIVIMIIITVTITLIIKLYDIIMQSADFGIHHSGLKS